MLHIFLWAVGLFFHIAIGIIFLAMKLLGNFTRIFYELEPGNLRKGLSPDQHADSIMEKLYSEMGWHKIIFDIVLWPISAVFFFKGGLSKHFVRGMNELIGKRR